jgi:hypothetical protein
LTFNVIHGTLDSRNYLTNGKLAACLIEMDIYFADPSEVPLPPDEVRIQVFKIDPYPDGRRLRVFFELTPFQQKPHGDIVVYNLAGNPVATASFIEAITPRNEMTLHLRTPNPDGHYSATLTVFYRSDIEEDNQRKQAPFDPEKKVVDEKTIRFEISQSG